MTWNEILRLGRLTLRLWLRLIPTIVALSAFDVVLVKTLLAVGARVLPSEYHWGHFTGRYMFVILLGASHWLAGLYMLARGVTFPRALWHGAKKCPRALLLLGTLWLVLYGGMWSAILLARGRGPDQAEAILVGILLATVVLWALLAMFFSVVAPAFVLGDELPGKLLRTNPRRAFRLGIGLLALSVICLCLTGIGFDLICTIGPKLLEEDWLMPVAWMVVYSPMALCPSLAVVAQYVVSADFAGTATTQE